MVAANTVSAALVPVEYCAIARASKPETMLYNSESIESTSELDRMAGDALAVEHRSGGGGGGSAEAWQGERRDMRSLVAVLNHDVREVRER